MSSGHFDGRNGKSRIAWLLGALLLVALATGCASLNEHMAMKDAAKAYKAGKYVDAAKFYDSALRINPARAENWKYLAYCYWNLIEPGSTQPKDQEYTSKALDAFQHYLGIVGKDDEVQDYIINLYINQNRLEEGVKFYEQALAKDPTDPRILQTLSIMYAKMNNFQKSLEYSEKKARLTPNDPSGYLYIGALCWNRSYNKEDSDEERTKIVERGFDALQTALKLDPNNFNAHLFMNLLYRQKAELAKNAAANEKDRRKAKELQAQADEFMAQADKERDTALAIRKGQNQASSTSAPSASSN
jgi:tetratricopeptide (TPR) repeat protein